MEHYFQLKVEISHSAIILGINPFICPWLESKWLYSPTAAPVIDVCPFVDSLVPKTYLFPCERIPVQNDFLVVASKHCRWFGFQFTIIAADEMRWHPHFWSKGVVAAFKLWRSKCIHHQVHLLATSHHCLFVHFCSFHVWKMWSYFNHFWSTDPIIWFNCHIYHLLSISTVKCVLQLLTSSLNF